MVSRDLEGWPGTPPAVGEGEEIRRFQSAVRARIWRIAADARRDLRAIPPDVLVSLLCAGAFSAVIGPSGGADQGAPPLAGGGVLAGLIAGAVDSLRVGQHLRPVPPEDLEREIFRQIHQVLAAGNDQAAALRADIARVLKETGAMRSALLAAIETGDDRLRGDVMAVIDTLSAGYPEMGFLLRDGDPLTLRGGSYGYSAVAPDGVRSPHWADGCPYRGLLPFDQAHAGLFCGRQRLTTELVVKLASRLAGPAMVVVSGASGAGKSSLLHAGLLPALAAGVQLAGSDRWPRVVMTPTGDPLTELATRLAALSGDDAAAIRRGLAADPEQANVAVARAVLADAGRRAAGGPGAAGLPGRLVLVVDQFEEVFTLVPGRDDSGQQAFIAALCAAATRPSGPRGDPAALVVIAVRGDFWVRCAADARLARMMQDGLFVVGPMTGQELRQAITGPAAAAGLQVDPDLAGTVLADLNAAGHDVSEGVLPLLSQAMMLTWEKREGNRLTARGYHETGGVASCVEFGAEAVYEALPDAGQHAAREVFQALVLASQDGQLVGRPVPRAELSAGRRDAVRQMVDTVLDAFADRRLLVLDGDTVQVAHDVLLRAWPRLRGWLERDRGALILHGQLAEDAAVWHDHGKDASYLYRGAQLAGVAEAVSIWSSAPGRYPSLTGQQQDFLDASAHAQSRQARRRRAAVIALAVLLVISAVSAGAAGLTARAEHAAARNASQQASSALSGELAAESEQLDSSDPVTAAQLAAAAWRIAPTPQAQQSMLDVLAQPQRAAFAATNDKLPVTAMAFDRGGQVLVTAGDDGLVRLWDVPTRRELGTPLAVVPNPGVHNGNINGNINGVQTIAVSSLGTLATAGDDPRVRLWNLASRREIGSPIGIPGSASALAFSPDGSTLAIGGGGTIRLWNVSSDKPADLQVGPAAGGPGTPAIGALAFSPDGKYLATCDGGNLQLWSMATGREVAGPVEAGGSPGDYLESIAFSPDGKTLATGGTDGKLRLWSAPGLQEIGAPITVSTKPPGKYDFDTVDSVAFSPDGAMVATGDADETTRLFDLSTRQQISLATTASTDVLEESAPFDLVLFSPDGSTLATAGNDGIVRLWDPDVYHQIGSPITVPVAYADTFMYAVEFSQDGKLLATANGDGSVRLWDVASRRQVGAISDGIYSAGNWMAFSPDGRILATGSADGTVRLRSVPSLRQVGAPINVGANTGLLSLAFSPSGAILATAGDGTVTLWNVATRRQIGRPLTTPSGSNAAIDAVAFSPDGRILATGGYNGTARLWNVAMRRQIGVPIISAGNAVSGLGVEAVAFNPTGSILATANGDGTARLWDVATQREVGPPLAVTQAGTDKLTAVAFSRGGGILITGDEYGSARLWNTATFQEIGPAITLPGQSDGITGMAVSPNGQMLATVGGYHDAAQLWDIGFPADLLRAVCAIPGSSLSPDQWHSYIPSRPYQPTC